MSPARQLFEQASRAREDHKACLEVGAHSAAEFFKQKAIWLVGQAILALAEEGKDGKTGKQQSGESNPKGGIKNSANTAYTGALSAAAYRGGN